MAYVARWIDKSEHTRFNDFLAKHPKGHVLQSWEWGEIKSRTGWQPWRLIIEKDNEIVAGASILERKIPVVGIPIFYASRGPVVDWKDTELFDLVLAEIKKLAKKRGAIFLKIDPDVPSSEKELENYLLSRGFRSAESGKGFEGVQPKYVFRLDISPDEATLLSNMQQKTRYNIRLAQKKGVQIRRGTRADLPDFYRVLKETTERDRFLVRAYSYFEDLYDSLVPQGLGELFIAEYEGQIISGTLAFVIGDKAWYIYGASSNSHRNVMPNYLIQWEMIRWAKSLGCTLYDFRGVPGHLTEDNPLYGLYRFKKGFNGDYTEFIGEWDLVYRPVTYFLWNHLEPIYSEVIKGLISKLRRMRRG
ncbi:putative methicillin resistance protein [Desulfosporosinus orientis DSM 765]|uniref:Putative methicillin resistance protein n=1 Tax=Desulfosporosinus orientis (strain ATCC 19365 / DSM 765 / NCIMB 8382 / VKM B-1628 / Singapore I) TaxID=768706 RepID=G7WHK0_DESOD|nr:peptidoglycan bridge formation glycyltransferase FemA/FemB family protein [Desulfosporosinus orientis]AET70921.1 putative methicillin resistance protein [Desulfosporosinus orientis DSM 765]